MIFPKRVYCWSILVFTLLYSPSFLAQTPCDSALVVSGWIFQGDNQIVPASMAVNRNSGGGVFVERDGSFLVRACAGDTLVFGALGYYSSSQLQNIC